MKTFNFCEISEEQIGENSFKYHVMAEYMDIDGYFIKVTHFSGDKDEAEAFADKYDKIFEEFSDSLTYEENENWKNSEFEPFYEFAIKK